MPLATIGTKLLLSPYDDVCCISGPAESEYIEDRSSIGFKVEGWLVEDGWSHGVYGTVTEGSSRYLELICSAMLRAIPYKDWHEIESDHAAFIVGPTKAIKNSDYDDCGAGIDFFRHPDGTFVSGYPYFSTYAGIREVSKADPKQVSSDLIPFPVGKFISPSGSKATIPLATDMKPAYELLNSLVKTGGFGVVSVPVLIWAREQPTENKVILYNLIRQKSRLPESRWRANFTEVVNCSEDDLPEV